MIKNYTLQSPLLFFVILVISAIMSRSAGTLIGHIDFTTYYSTEASEWVSEFRHGEWENPDARTPTR